MNHLQYETSPYLLQHAHNPVDWYAWKPEAFERARTENKPILVSIGYSTCHWCHVMERESFENQEIADFMNAHYINIKVDREERPDVDAIYMEACQILTGSGGWPLNCFLTPEGKPFFAGTYYPPQPAYNRPSWQQVLQHLATIWESKRETAYEQADKLLGYISRNDDVFLKKTTPELVAVDGAPAFTPALLENIFYQMREQFDRVEGGFGNAPKFPSTMAIQYLFNYHWFTKNEEAVEQALLSLDKMIMGGIYDQLGGGFSRYSTDREWLAPHFEKMLYDNALLVTVLSDAIKLLQSPEIQVRNQEIRLNLYQETVRETLDYINREMLHPAGGFYSAQDADSEGVEGKFYVWSKKEIETLLGKDADLFCDFYDVSANGNWEHANILRRLKTFETFAAARQLDVSVLKETLAQQREVLFRQRTQRIYPGLDDKILLSWNALMCTAFASAYTALGMEAYRDTAVRNLEFMLENMAKGPSQRLYHTWKNQQVQYMAVLDDYAFLLMALIDIWQITFNSRYLTLAEKYTEQVLSYFHDTDSGMFFFTASDQTDIILRKKDLYDNATPSGNSTMAHVLQRLGILCDRSEWRELAGQMLLLMKASVERYPLSFERWASAIMFEVHPFLEIAVVGGNAAEKAQTIQKRFLPNKVLAASVDQDDNNPLLAGKSGDSEALIYLCRNYACMKPVQTLEDLDELIRTNL